MKLSGWARLWIVASVLWWAFGAWRLVETFGNIHHVDCNEPPRAAPEPGLLALPPCWSPATSPTGGGPPNPYLTIYDDWWPWLTTLGIVIGVPIAVALAFLIARAVGLWIWRGFRPSA